MADAAETNDLAPGWVKMQDQYGDYYINLHTKQTSRIRPVQASSFPNTLPPPPPAPAPDDNNDNVPADNDTEDQAQSPQQANVSPHSQQQAMQQQMYNQQLYQQQWQRYYAQQQWQQQQWAAQQQQQNQNQQNQMQQYPQQNQMGQYQMQMGQYPQQMQPNMQQNMMEMQQNMIKMQQNMAHQEEESSASTINDGASGSDLPNDDEKLQVQQVPEPQQNIPQNDIAKPKEVPPINNDKAKDDKVEENEQNAQYRFQPIVPPQMNMGQSNESFRTASIISISQKVDISPISEKHSAVFHPNKILLAANVDFTGNLPVAMEPPAEGTDIADPLLSYGQSQSSSVNDDVAAPAPVIDKQQSTIFGVMLQQADKNKHLKLEENWEMLIDGIEQNCRVQDQYDVFKAMRKVAKNLLIDDEKYRTVYADNDMVQKKLLGRVGGFEFLRGIGFKQGADDNELICYKPDQSIVNLAIKSLQKRINSLKQRKHEWDPKYRMGGGGGGGGLRANVPKQKPVAYQGNGGGGVGGAGVVVGGGGQDEEDRQLQEALRLSQQQHVQDMLARQQRELDFAKKRGLLKSVNIYKPNEEDDQKAAFE